MPSHVPLLTLPWLPRPGAADRPLLEGEDLAELVAAARLGWSASQLAAIGRRAARASRETAVEAGLLPFELLAIAPHTLTHVGSPGTELEFAL